MRALLAPSLQPPVLLSPRQEGTLFRFQVAGDPGQRVVLAQDLRSGQAVVPAADLPAGGQFELILSDGLNTVRQQFVR